MLEQIAASSSPLENPIPAVLYVVAQPSKLQLLDFNADGTLLFIDDSVFNESPVVNVCVPSVVLPVLNVIVHVFAVHEPVIVADPLVTPKFAEVHATLVAPALNCVVLVPFVTHLLNV